MENISSPSHVPTPAIRIVDFLRPFQWLKHGLRDLLRAWPMSLSYGALFAALGHLGIRFGWERPHLVTALMSGFFLVAPFLAIGLYQISRRLERRESPGWSDTLGAWRANPHGIAFFGVVLVFMVVSWERISAIIFALFYSGNIASVENLIRQVLLSGQHLPLTLAYFGFGALFALVAFAISAVAIPMLLDRDTDTVTAMVTSLKAVGANPGPMALWAGLIVALTALGFATLFIGLVFTFPLLGHATWHAYRDLVE